MRMTKNQRKRNRIAWIKRQKQANYCPFDKVKEVRDSVESKKSQKLS
jgi:hypothetical protein